MHSTFGSFTTARLALMASQKSLDVTGHNISNINTSGFTRQRADLISLSMSGGSEKYASKYNSVVGHGVLVKSISQIRDPFLDKRFRNEIAKVGETDEKVGILKDLQNILNEVTTDGINAQLSEIASTLTKLSKEVGNNEFDAMVRASSDVLTQLFKLYSSQVAGQRDDCEKGITEIDVPKINDIIKNISDLNKTIKTNEIHGGTSLDLRDKRNMLIDELASFVHIETVYEDERITDSTTVENLKINLILADGTKYEIINNDKNNTFSSLTAGSSISLGGTNISDKLVSSPLTEKHTEDINNLLAVLADDKTTAEERAKALESLQTYFKTPLTDSEAGNNVTGGNGTISIGGIVLVDGKNITKSTDKNGKEVNGVLFEDKKTNVSIEHSNLSIGTPPLLISSKLGGDVSELNRLFSILMKTRNTDTTTTEEADKKLLDIQKYKTEITDMLKKDFGIDMVINVGNKGTDMTMSVAGDATVYNLSNGDALIPFEISKTTNNITENMGKGSLKSSLELVNCSGEFDVPATFRGIGYYEKMLDMTANKIINELNEANKICKLGADGKPVEISPGVYEMEERPLFETTDGSKTFTASNIKIAKGWSDGTYGITANKDPSTPLGSSENVLHMLKLFTDKFEFKAPNATANESIFKGTFQECFTNITTQLGLDIKSQETILTNYVSVANEIADLKDGVSGVNLDDETMNLIQFQHSYNAAARLMTTLDEAVDTIINRMGIVGR